jgi:hypothetical protein
MRRWRAPQQPTHANMIPGLLEGKIIAQADLQERSKRDRECERPSQGSPHQVKSKRKQVLQRREIKSGDTTAVQKGLSQYGFGLTAEGGTQRRPMEERQQLSLDEEKHSVEAPRLTISQDYRSILGEENRRKKVAKSNSQQDAKAPC